MIYWTDEVTGQRYATHGLSPVAGDLATMPDGTWRRVLGVGISAQAGKATVFRATLTELVANHELRPSDGPLPPMTDEEWAWRVHLYR